MYRTPVQGKLTLLLAPPSSGKTTFLRALAGRLPAGSYTGDITYNGHSAADFSPARSIAYVAQFDTHIPNLTARETVEFAYDIQHSPAGEPVHHASHKSMAPLPYTTRTLLYRQVPH